MKFAIICPIPLLNEFAVASDYHMALTHLVLMNQQYTSFYKARSLSGDYVILDNSIIELGNAVDILKLVEAAELIHATEIVLPDVYRNKDATLSAVHHALEKGKDRLNEYKLMAVPQGQNYAEWFECYHELITIKEIDVIGIPKVTSTFGDSDKGRIVLCDILDGKQRLGIGTDKEYHLLGVWNNPYPEIPKLSAFSWIRGVDTILPIQMGQRGISLSETRFNRPQIKADFYDGHTGGNSLIIESNIFKMLSWGRSRC